MKHFLNQLAIWLYKKTRCPGEIPNGLGEIFKGTKVYGSKFLPKDTMYVGTNERLQLEIWALDKKIMMEDCPKTN